LSFDAAYGPDALGADEDLAIPVLIDNVPPVAGTPTGVSPSPMAGATPAGASPDVEEKKAEEKKAEKRVKEHVKAQTTRINKSKKKVAKIHQQAAEIKKLIEDKKAEMPSKAYKQWKADRRKILIRLEQRKAPKPKLPPLPPKPKKDP
jgi:hypothetical protein